MIEVQLAFGGWAEPARLVSGESISLGKDPTLGQLAVLASGVSRRHCEISCRQLDVVVRDLGSTNGTYVNGRWITEAPLIDGDSLWLGAEVRIAVQVTSRGAPESCSACDAALTGSERVDNGRYRDDKGVYCLACASAGAGTFQTFAGYRLLRLLGRGGGGRVFEAISSVGARVALKILAASGDDPARAAYLAARFTREAAVLRSLDHPSIVRYVGSGMHERLPYMALQFIDGDDYGQLYRARGRPFSPAELSPLVEATSAALAHAHARGVIHRDVKPSNLLRDADGTIRVTDFGLARLSDAATMLTTAGGILGTLEFMAPEQVADAHEVDGRADVYALAATLFYLMSGRRPYPAANDLELVSRIQQDSVPRLLAGARAGVPEAIDALLHQAMAKAPGDRPANPGAFAAAWTAALG